MTLAALLHLILPALGSETAARTLALRMLGEHQPETVRELHLAGEIIGFSLNTLKAQGDCGAADITPEKLLTARRWACSLSRAGNLAQRRLDEIQRRRRAGLLEIDADSPPVAVAETASAAPEPAPQLPAQPEAEAASQPAAEAALQLPAHPEADAVSQPAVEPALPEAPLSPDSTRQPAAAGPDVALAAAEAEFTAESAALRLMKARWKGAPPPHTPAAQQIQAQQRRVAGARMRLDQVRRRCAQGTMRAAPALA